MRRKYRLQWPPRGSVSFGDLRRVTPVSASFGMERGRPIDRYYIEAFLEANAADIKAARAAFGDLSDVVLAWAGEGTGGKGVRVAYCPMVKKSWLQTGGEIANPYYGSGMLRCGSFTK